MAGVEERVEDQVDPIAGVGAPRRPARRDRRREPGHRAGDRPRPRPLREEVAELARKARAAQPGWQALGFEGRARVLRRAQKWIVDNRDRIIETIVAETGKTYEDALHRGVQLRGRRVRVLGQERAEVPRRREGPDLVAVRHRPQARRRATSRSALVGVIGPWNYPLTNSFGDCIPALAAGNAVILKPSEVTPMTSLLMAEMLRECGLPEDVYQVATGRGETAQALVDEVDMIMFTGSTRTGKKVMERAAKTLTPVALELGGKDPMIVLDDADVERAANAAVYYSMQNGGQTCISVERVYVEEPVYDEFVAKVTEKARALRQGVPGGPASVDVGAVTSPPQFDIIDDARPATPRQGRADRRRRPRPARRGRHLLRADGHGRRRPHDEGDDRGDLRADAADHEGARRRGGDPRSPTTRRTAWRRRCARKDAARGEAVARRVQAGAVDVNDAMLNYTALELPMGGWKASGLGSRHGAGGIRKYCAQQAILVTRLAPEARHPHVPVPQGHHEAHRRARQAPLRARQALLAPQGLRRTRHPLLAVGLALLAASCWGVADFIGGLKSRSALGRRRAARPAGGGRR